MPQRREFLKSTAAASGLMMLSSFTEQQEMTQPVETRIRFSVININHKDLSILGATCGDADAVALVVTSEP